MATFGKRLKELRLERRLTQKELAHILKLSESAVSMYERDEREPSFDTLNILSKLFSVKRAYLLGDTDDRSPDNLKEDDSKFNALLELNKLFEKHGITDAGFLDYKKWESMGPEEIKSLDKYFEFLSKESQEKD